MTPTDIALLISGVGTFLSLLGTAVGVGIVYGTLRSEVRELKAGRGQLATKADVQLMAVQLAEIRGMFRLTPVDGPPQPQLQQTEARAS